MFRRDTSPAASLAVDAGNFESICKAAVAHIDDEHDAEQPEKQNPASRKLDQLVNETYDAMAFSLLKEISEVFSGK